jgi:hypothetical protein
VERQAAVTQDMLLVPRMVYMPYMPYTPTAPARMRVADVRNRTYVDEREPGTPRNANVPQNPPGDEKTLETLDQCQKLMMKMNQRIHELETRTTTIVTQPTPVPPWAAGPDEECPPLCQPPWWRLFNRRCPPTSDCSPVPVGP